jgi:predicted house-cleaning noncanonical NTP pyrophosphatase (MazG superfamily)
VKTHNKLVRDNIPQIVVANGGTAQTRRIDDDAEFINELTKKLIEEAHEVQEDPSLEELADLREVADKLLETLGYSEQELIAAKTAKANKNGAFNNRVFLISTEG